MSPAAAPGPKRLWQFDEFVVDPVRRLLLRSGEAVALTPKPMSILLVLLERQGEVVTKQELIERVWPDIHVTEANLTQNISTLRKVLGERANARRYIVTVPGQGYSFAGMAMEAGPAGEPPPAESAAAPAPVAEELPAAPEPPAPAVSPPPTVDSEAVARRPRPADLPRSRRSWSLLALALAVAAAAATIWLAGRQPARPALPAGDAAPAVSPGPAVLPAASGASPAARRRSVAVLGFRNLAGERSSDWLAPALAEMLTTEMVAGSRVRVISGENVLRARRSLSLPYTDRLGGADLEQLHSLLGADVVVVGAYLALGPPAARRIRLDLRVLEVPSGDTVASIVQVGAQAELFDLVSQTGAELRRVLGVADLSSAEQQEARALRPDSVDAARLYTQGLARLRAFDPPAARAWLEQAVLRQPASPLFHSALSQAWSALGYDGRAAEEARQAFALSAALPREEKLAIEARLHETAKDWRRASELYRTLWAFFPDDVEYGLQLARTLLMDGRGGDAAATLAALHRLPAPSGQDPRIDLLESRVAARLSNIAGQMQAAAAAEEKGRARHERQVVAQALVMAGNGLISMGRQDEAIRKFHDALALSRQGGFDWVVGMALANLGTALQNKGDLAGAEKAHGESLVIARKLGTGVGIESQDFLLGRLHQDRGELAESLRFFADSRRWAAEIGDRMTEGRALRSIASLLCSGGDLTGCRRNAETAVAISREIGNRMDEAEALLVIGRLLELRGELGRARRYDLDAVDVFRRSGNPGLAASALRAAAEVAARLGDLPGARRRLETALAVKQRTGDRIGQADLLGSLSRVGYVSGDLPAARAFAEEQLRLAQQTGARGLWARGQRNLGRSALAAGELAAASLSLGEALNALTGMGEDLEAAGVRLDLARTALAADDPGRAASLAREAAAWYAARGIPAGEARALALLAEAALRQGDLAAARRAAVRAQAIAARSEERELRIEVASRVARVEAAAGPAGEALAALEAAIADAQQAGMVAAALEARLALGEIRLQQRDLRGAKTLEAVRGEAVSRGFALVARLAAGPLLGRQPLG